LSGNPNGAHTPERIRELLHRKGLAGSRHRSAVARLLGLTDTEMAALTYLAYRGNLTPGQLGRLLFLTSGGVSALTQRMDRAGHVERQPHPRDGRSTVLTPTASVLDQAEEHYAELTEELDRAAARLPASERAVIGRFLDEVVAIAERQAEAAATAAGEAERVVTGVPSPGLWA
jgi:DNA-binding MarR family transcriptional regulator